MAWKEVKVEDQRKKFILTVSNGSNISDACQQFGISRPTGYKWIKRWQDEGFEGLCNRSTAPLSRPRMTEESIEDKILEMRFRYPKWGPKKILAQLSELDSETNWPCPSTIGNVLDRNGLTVRRKLRKRVVANAAGAFNGEYSNEVWCMDFKGTLKTIQNGGYDPFTLTDSSSRFLIKCQILQSNNTEHVWATLDTAFREYGLPEHIVSDNGPPFATVGVGRYSRLSINLIKAGVKPLWIAPGQPQQNGRHERMHGTIELELGKPAANSYVELKRKLLEFQNYYNYERPHEALGQITPGKVYSPSNRTWNGIFRSPEYGSEYEIRRVQKNGVIDFEGKRIFLGEALYKEPVGLLETKEGLSVYYGENSLGVINDKFKMVFKKNC